MMSSHCLMYLPSDFGFLFLLKEDLPMLSFVSPWIVLYIWIFRRCMNLFVISTSWREVTCWRRLGALESDCLCSVPALTCDLYSHHVSYMKQSSSSQLSREWQHFYEVTPYYITHVRGDTLPYYARGQCTMKWISIHIIDSFKCLETIF